MPAAPVNMTIEQGSTWLESFAVTYLDTSTQPPVELVYPLTGWKARLQARSSIVSDTLLLELTTENGGIILNGPAGLLTLSMSAAATAAISWSPSGKYQPATGVYLVELERIADGFVERFITGVITIDPEITRPPA